MGEWQEYFGFAEPYENQRDAIEAALAAADEDGYLLVEGPCGTGKTMAALAAAATAIREGDYENAVVVTPVKQQREQFVDDLRALNDGREEPLTGVALVGKRDLCPYGREGVFPEGSVHERCERLRETTAGLVESDGAATGTGAEAVVGGADGDTWWDPGAASELVREARAELGDGLATAGGESPYQRAQPSAPEGDALYCPFEADWYARDRGSPIGFGAGDRGVITAEQYLPAATERGTCPHRAMSVLLEAAEVVIGNYNHLFDPTSRPLLEPALGEDTFLIVDEAHRLEERVRDLLSDRVGRATLKRARNDCATVASRANETTEARQAIEESLASHEVPLAAVERARNFYDDLLSWLDDRVETGLDEHVGRGWRVDPDRLPERDLEVPLRDPETAERDELTAWAERAGYGGDLWRSLATVGTAVEDTLDALGLARTPVCASVGAIAQRWYESDHARYLREIELEHAPAETADTEWGRTYTAGLVLYECMPGETLAQTFEELGGGMAMSATLEPIDVFREVAGFDALPADRPVIERAYELPFPPENRASFLVDATPFTARNRGDPADNATPETWTRTRNEYAQALRVLARSPGNVLLAMPSYAEARWAGEYLADAVEKPVLIDEPSSNEATERRKHRFFAGEGKILTTSVRGTLTEGVDYDGEKLRCCAVVGVPLVNVGSPRTRAVRRAYGDAFGEDRAFAYALTAPAIRRARQALGRVIRGPEEVGVRALVDGRYAPDARRSVSEFLPETDRAELVRLTPAFLADELDSFWADREH